MGLRGSQHAHWPAILHSLGIVDPNSGRHSDMCLFQPQPYLHYSSHSSFHFLNDTEYGAVCAFLHHNSHCHLPSCQLRGASQPVVGHVFFFCPPFSGEKSGPVSDWSAAGDVDVTRMPVTRHDTSFALSSPQQ